MRTLLFCGSVAILSSLVGVAGHLASDALRLRAAVAAEREERDRLVEEMETIAAPLRLAEREVHDMGETLRGAQHALDCARDELVAVRTQEERRFGTVDGEVQRLIERCESLAGQIQEARNEAATSRERIASARAGALDAALDAQLLDFQTELEILRIRVRALEERAEYEELATLARLEQVTRGEED